MCAALVVFLGSRSRSTYDNIVDGLQKEGRRRLLLENTHGTEGHLPNTEYRIYGRGGGEGKKDETYDEDELHEETNESHDRKSYDNLEAKSLVLCRTTELVTRSKASLAK